MLRSALRATRLGALAPARALSTLAPALRPLAPRASPLLRNCAPPRLAPSPLRTLCSSAEGFAPPPPPLPRSGLGGPVQRGGMAGAASEAMRRMPRNPGQAGVISIRSTWNNTIVNVADAAYRTKAVVSAGTAGFKKSKRSSVFAMEKTLSLAFSKARAAGIRRVMLTLTGPAVFLRKPLFRQVREATGLRVMKLRMAHNVPHGGCRPRKSRRRRIKTKAKRR